MNYIFNRRDIGYTIISRFEETLRVFLSEALVVHFSNYQDGIPNGVIMKAQDRATSNEWEDVDELINNTDFPDLKEIICFNQMYATYFPSTNLKQEEFESIIENLYSIRNKIAHVKNHFSTFDLDRLLEGTRKIASQLEQNGKEFIKFTRNLEKHPKKFVLPMPVEFSDSAQEIGNIPNNIPIPDYEYEGGFVGRVEDTRKITKLLEGSRNVITISGAGGVGKTALALRVIQNFLQRPDPKFDGIVWLSAKETRLSYLGIEDVEPTVKNYEELLDAIFEVMGFGDPSAGLERKESDVKTIFELYKNMLIVIDNFETITDDRITNFILDIEDTFPIVKILITSRRGLGQVERRHELKQLKIKEAVNLFRRVSRDKKLDDLARIDELILEDYVKKVACYPLAIKWVIGQVAIGKNINDVISAINETTSDISKFSFEQVYNSLSLSAKKILCALSVLEDVPSAGVLNFVVDTDREEFEDSLQELILVSLVIPESYKNEQNEISNRYTLLSLTRGYVRQQLDNDPILKRELLERLDKVQSTMEEAERARKQYKFSLANLGAITEEEKVAAMIAQNAFQKYQSGRYLDAVEDYKRAIEIAPRFASLYRNWAVMEASEQHSIEANELMKKAAKLNPEDTQIWLTWGNIRRKEDKIKDALEKYEKAYQLSPEDEFVLNALGQAKARNGEYEEAIALFEQALKRNSDSATVQSKIINHSSIAKTLLRWAEADRNTRNHAGAGGKLENALDHCKVTLKLDPSDKRSQDLYRKILLALGFLYLEKDSQIALGYFEQVIVKKPIRYKEAKDTAEASIQASKILHQFGRLEEANRIFPHNLKSSSMIVLKQNPRLRDEFDMLLQQLHATPPIQKRETGVVKLFNHTRGYGFIIRDQGGDVFVHVTNIRNSSGNSLQEGQKVEYVMGIPLGKDREQAMDVTVIN